jgi:outer membrane protein assembly factor BamB
MKTRTTLAFVALLAFMLMITSLANARVVWNPATIQTVLSPGTETWEKVEVWHPNVMYDNGIYKMWYAGTMDRNGSYENGRGIGYATSTDGVTWTNRQLVYGPTTGYAQVDSPKVIKEGSFYKMWFREYYELLGPQWSGYVSYMTSSDGISWSTPEQVMSAQGQSGTNADGYNITNLSILKEDSQYTMWYAVDDLPPIQYKTWRATSTDGITWTNRQLSLPYVPGTWGAYDPNVSKLADGGYIIFYTTGYPDPARSEMQLATATSWDGITWSNRLLIGVEGHSPFYFEDIDGTPYLYFSNGGSIFRMSGTMITDGTLKWAFPTNGEVSTSPAIAPDGTIYFGSHDNKLYAVNPDGTKKWEFLTNGRARSSPAIGSDGTIYFGSEDNHLYAVNPNGTQKWAFLTGNWAVSSPAIASDGTVYVGSHDGKLYSISPSGTKNWEFKSIGGAQRDWVVSSPAIGPDGTIFVGSEDHRLYAIEPDGTLKWTFITGEAVSSSPAIDLDGTIYVESFDGYLYAINPDGTQNWKSPVGDGGMSSPTLSCDGTVYVGSYYDAKIYTVDREDGSILWAFQTGGQVTGSPTVGSDGSIYVPSKDGKIYALNPDGSQRWAFTTGGAIEWSSPAIGLNGVVYFGSDDGKLYAINTISDSLAASPWPIFHHDIAHTGRLSELSSITVTGPNGGEEFPVNSVRPITWTNKGNIDFVDIHYSTDNGVEWVEIITNLENTGMHMWLVPCELSSECLVKVSDSQGRASDTCDSVFSITDKLLPSMTLTVTPDTLWPPNNKMMPISVTVTATDNCDPAPVIKLKSITMIEGNQSNTYDPTLGDGNTGDDIHVDSSGNIYLRAERLGKGIGRTYTITYTATDVSGNSATASANVTVPHDQGKKK